MAEQKVTQLAAAATLEFLKSRPGNNLEQLKRNREGSTAFELTNSGEFVSWGTLNAQAVLKLLTISNLLWRRENYE